MKKGGSGKGRKWKREEGNEGGKRVKGKKSRKESEERIRCKL